MGGRAHSVDVSNISPERPEWWDRARCVVLHVDMFFPEVPNQGRSKERISLEDAQQIAADKYCWGKNGLGECPARSECLLFALSTGTNSGVWGGHTENQLQDMLNGQEAQKTNADTKATLVAVE